MKIREVYEKGILILHEEIEEKDDDQIALRDTINAAINDLTVIVDAAAMTNPELLAASKRKAQILRGILRYFKKDILR